MIRGAFIRAAKGLEDDGRPLSKIIREQLEESPLATLRTMASFVPKEQKLDVTNRTVHSVSELTDAELEQLKSLAVALTGGDGADAEEAGEEQSANVH